MWDIFVFVLHSSSVDSCAIILVLRLWASSIIHRSKLIGATTCTALKGIVQPRLTTPLPSRINLQPSSQVPTCELGCKLVLDGFEPWRLDLQPRSQVHQSTHLCAYL